MRSDDVARRMVRPPGPDLGFRQGVIVGWDPISKTSTIDVGGTTLNDVPLLVTSSVTIKAGDVVGLLRVRSQYFLLGKILPPSIADTVATAGVYGVGTGAMDQWPQTASTTEVGLIAANIRPHGTVIGWRAWTSVQVGATARYRAYINGVLVGDSGVYSTGIGEYIGLVDWPAGSDNPNGAVFELRALVVSGAAGLKAAATLVQLYEE